MVFKENVFFTQINILETLFLHRCHHCSDICQKPTNEDSHCSSLFFFFKFITEHSCWGPSVFTNFLIHCRNQTFIGNRRPPTSFLVMNIGASIIELLNTLSHHSIAHYTFTINFYKFMMNFSWLNILCVQKWHYRTHLAVIEISNGF